MNNNNNNKGLEALAALASASSHRNNNDQSNGERSGSSSSAETATAPQIDFQSIVNLTAALQQQQHNQQQQGTRNTATINQQQQLLAQALSSGMNPAAMATLLQGLAQNVGVNFNNNNNNSQFDLMNILANAQSSGQQQLPAAANNQFAGLPSLQNQALQMLLSGRTGATTATDDSSRSATSSQVLPRSQVPVASPHLLSSLSTGNMPPPQPSQASVGSLPADAVSLQQQKQQQQQQYDTNSGNYYSDEEPEGKKQMKRAANRKSAQLSRKRKKQFIEELKEENDGLRRKEQILRSIPDLVVVFDSSGKLWFVSESVERFLSFTASELEGTSFWDRLSPESVRILKAAFMDSLAAREDVSDTVQLGTGVWELELVDKSNTEKRVSLNGVVHFAGERPECVCSIRPLDMDETTATSNNSNTTDPQQQTSLSKPKVRNNNNDDEPKRRKRGDATRISDSGNSSSGGGDSESDETGG